MAEKKRKSSLIANLIIMIGIVILALTLIQVTVLSSLAKSDSRKDNVDSYVLLTTSIKQNLENIIEGYFKEMDTYVNADIMRDGDFDAAGRWLQEHPEIRGKDFDYIMIADGAGYSYNDNGSRTDIAERDYFQAIMKQGKDRFVDNPVISKTTGNRVIHITRSVHDKNGKVFAMVAGVINVDVLIKPVKEVKVSDDIWIFLIDHNGAVIYHPVATDDGNFITNPGEGHDDLSEISKRMVNGESSYAWIVSYTGSKEDLIVYSGIDGTPWGLGFLVPGNTVDALGTKIARTTVIFGAIIVLIVIIIGATIMGMSLKPLNIVKDAVVGIAQGNADLTQRITIKSNNEIGQVVQGFNNFTEKLQSIISDVKESRNELGQAGEDMSATAEDMTSAITQILENIEQFKKQLDNQKGSVDQTAGAVNEISSNIESLNHMISSQSSGVTQASSAVEQMIGNINSVSNSMEKMDKSFGGLQSHSQEGFTKLETVSQKVHAIENQSAALKEANVAIANIAEQTNLLAMNAAIEAAHAGEAGKGFAVVADEIRKLSETSSQQSTQITNQLNQIMESIKQVVGASSDASSTFALVSQELTATDELVMQIRTAMEEQNEGSQQILESLKMMNNSTSEVRNASVEMQEGNKLILSEVKNLQDATVLMKSSMEEMTVGARKINETGTVLSEVSDRMKGSIDKIGKQIDEFKV